MCVHVSVGVFLCMLVCGSWSTSLCVYVPACVSHSYVTSSTWIMPACVCVFLLSFSFDACCPHMCSLYTALCSGWSRSGRAALTAVLSAAGRPGPPPPCRPSSTPRSSSRSDGCPTCWSRAKPASLACGKMERHSVQGSHRLFLSWRSLGKER